MDSVIHTKIGQGRRVAIPVDLCEQYGIEPGDPIVLEGTNNGIFVRPLKAVIKEVQNFFADAAPSGVLLSEELSADRRREAKQDEHG